MEKDTFLSSVFSFLVLFLFALCTAFPGTAYPGEEEPYPLMHFDRGTFLEMTRDMQAAKAAPVNEALLSGARVKRSVNFIDLGHIDYVPVERDQGPVCGNCWVWAGTGIMEVALSVQGIATERLSVQYVNSCYGTEEIYACCGGWLENLAEFYQDNPELIPWDNRNASYQDTFQSCENGFPSVLCSQISTNPSYEIQYIESQTIPTQQVSQNQAVQEIKNRLNDNRAVQFAFFLARDEDWDNFRLFWGNEGESDVWNPDFACDRQADSEEIEGHAVLCVGYNDDSPGNAYWIMLNSWGTADGERPNGTFRLDMDMEYDCMINIDTRPGYKDEAFNFYWETLDISFGDLPLVVTGSATAVTSGSATLNGSVNPKGVSTATYFEFGRDTNYGMSTTPKDRGSGTVSVDFSTQITGLSAAATYHYRAVATSGGIPNNGKDRIFTTTGGGGNGGGGGVIIGDQKLGSGSDDFCFVSAAARGFSIEP